jgi:hypothetical protein
VHRNQLVLSVDDLPAVVQEVAEFLEPILEILHQTDP